MRKNQPSFYNTLIGFDNIFSELHDSALDKYPPYNLFREGLEQDRNIIEIALAGFKKSEITITLVNSTLTVESSKKETEDDLLSGKRSRTYAHKGISKRYFKRQFQLAEYQFINSASMIDGMLNIVIDKKVPEALKPKVIDIT